MGYMIIRGPCYVCKQIFEYNAESVPSMTPPGRTFAEREPVCEACMAKINTKREEMGLPPVAIRRDAYEAQEV